MEVGATLGTLTERLVVYLTTCIAVCCVACVAEVPDDEEGGACPSLPEDGL